MCSVSLGRWRKCSVGLEKGREINCLTGPWERSGYVCVQ